MAVPMVSSAEGVLFVGFKRLVTLWGYVHAYACNRHNSDKSFHKTPIEFIWFCLKIVHIDKRNHLNDKIT